jgi:hypothetical protein
VQVLAACGADAEAADGDFKKNGTNIFKVQLKVPQQHCEPLVVQLRVSSTSAGLSLDDADLAQRFQVRVGV